MKRLMILVMLVLFVVTGGIVAQEDNADDAPFTPSPELVERMDDIEALTSEIRGLDSLEEVPRLFPTRDEARAYINDSIAGDEALYRNASQFYIAFDFLPPGSDLLTIYLDFLGAQVGGYYDPETGEMNVVLITGVRPTDRLPLTEQIVYAHEYTHALQDQHFGLDGLLGDVDEQIANPDRTQAVLSLIEGDATFVMNEYTRIVSEENPIGAIAELLLQGAASGTLTLPEGTPPIIQAELLSPYLDGAAFVGYLIAEGGGTWDLVNAAYNSPPESTEQILHPDRYLAGDVPIAVELAPPVDLGTAWALLYDRPMGEFYLRQYLSTQLGFTDARAAATGWGGDRYQLYYNAEDDTRAWVMRLVWDTPEDAAEFATSYIEFGMLRYDDATPDEDGCWTNDAGESLCFVVTEDGNSLIAFAPTLDMAQLLLEAQREPVE